MKDRLSELILILLVCLAPWAFGSVEAWAELGLYIAIAFLTLLNLRRPSGRDRGGFLLRLPSLALAGLVSLALLQAMPLQRGVLARISPISSPYRAHLLPDQSEHVIGDTGATVALPTESLSLESDSTLQMAARLAAAWLLFRAVVSMRGIPGLSRRVARAVVFNAAMLSLFAIVQGLSWNGCIYWVRPAQVSADSWSAGGPFLSHSHLAAYLNLGLGLALGMLMQGDWRDLLRRDSTKLWTAYAAAIIAVGVIVSHSRSGFLGLVSAGFLMACYLRRRLIPLAVALAVIVVMIGLCLLLVGAFSSFGSRLGTILDAGNEGYSNRTEIWRGALRAWWARPFLGSGLGVFPVAVIPYLEQTKVVFFARAENEYVDMLVEGGAFGFLLVLTFLAGIGGLARRAIRSIPGGPERGVVGGAVFGLIALSAQSCADFAPHIPAVGVLAMVLCGLIARQARTGAKGRREHTARSSPASAADRTPPMLGIGHFALRRSPSRWLWDAIRPRRSATDQPRPKPRPSDILMWLGSIALSAVLVAHGVRNARVEKQLQDAGLPLPGSFLTTVGTLETAIWGLDEYRAALEYGLRLRPNWADGHLRLGLVHLGLYRSMSKEWLVDTGVGLDDMNRMSEPLWLLGTVHEPSDRAAGTPGKQEVLGFEPVINHLVPAAHCFLEARRCSPFLALPHAELAALDYLLSPGDPASTYVTRALRLAGNDGLLINFLAQVAVQAGDLKLAARCWQKSLEINPAGWGDVADLAGLVLSPDEILSEVTTDKFQAIRFADRLYPGDDDEPIRNRFFQAALDRPAVGGASVTPEQLFLEAHALASLDDSDRADKQMEQALELEPTRAEWRLEYIEWLLYWGRAEEAHEQALKGQYFSPASGPIRQALDRTAEAVARDETSP